MDALPRTAGVGAVSLLPAWGGAPALTVYAVAACGVALALTVRRDIT